MGEEASGRGRIRWAVAAVILVVLALGSVALAVTSDDRSSGLGVDAIHAAPTGTWKRVADAPLSPRSNALMAWTGTEVLVIGGDVTSPCPPTANCIDTGDPAPRDGAAYDPDAGTWRPIADAPVDLSWGQPNAVADGVLYVQHPEDATQLLRYDPAGDAWDEIGAPPMLAGRTLVSDGDQLLAPLTHTLGIDDQTVDLVYDAQADSWEPLPADPIRNAQARQVQPVGDRLYLIAGSLDPEVDAMSAIVHAAVLEDGTWRRLPDPNTDGYLPSLAGDDLIMSPQDDETAGDGDDVPGWWALDTTTDEWVDVPEIPSAPGPDVAGAWFAGDHQLFVSNLVMDTAARTWAPLGAPDELERQGLSATALGDQLMVFGGSTLDGEGFEAYADAQHQHDAWIWTPKP